MTRKISHYIYYYKVNFFWDQSQNMSLSGFLPKKQGSDWLTYLVYQLEACFFGEETTWTYVLTRISEKTNSSIFAYF